MKPYYQDDLVTLYHGDCLEVFQWLDADVLVTDPPYGMSYKSGRSGHHPAIKGDKTLDVRDAALAMWGTRPALVFGTWKQPRPANVRQLIVWDKRGGAGFSGDLNMPWADITEEVYVLGHGWTGGRRPAIISVPTLPSQSRPDHPTPKPVPLMGHLLDCAPLGVIADPFAGSGATLLAARNAGRRAIGVEMEERYCQLMAERLGQQAFDLTVDHMCKNRACIEPTHLRLLTRGDNSRDGSRITSEVCKRGHSLADAHLYTDKAGSTHRSCRTCRIEINERSLQRRYPNRVPYGPRLPHTIAAAARRSSAA